jgi:predicted DNA-binding protein (MmcQ/YjbR family)
MNIEKEIFNKYLIIKDKLLKYGFKFENGKLVYNKYILNNTFYIILEYDNEIKGKIIDLSFDEEYTNYRAEMLGEYNSNIKKEFVDLLIDIRDKCCEIQLFRFEQTKRLNEYIISKYDNYPEFLWDKYPNFAVYRNKKNKKWYAIIMNIPLNKLYKNIKSEKEVEIVNVKIDRDKVDEYVTKNGIYEAYHMNKKSWISIMLDDTLSDSTIQKFINDSFSNIK